MRLGPFSVRDSLDCAAVISSKINLSSCSTPFIFRSWKPLSINSSKIETNIFTLPFKKSLSQNIQSSSQFGKLIFRKLVHPNPTNKQIISQIISQNGAIVFPFLIQKISRRKKNQQFFLSETSAKKCNKILYYNNMKNFMADGRYLFYFK